MADHSRPSGVFVGLATLDVIHRVHSNAQANEKITATAQFVAAGGPAANAAVTFAALGGRATLVTALGHGPVAAIIRDDLAEYGVDVIDVDPERRSQAPVSSISVSESSGERAVVSIDGTQDEVSPPAGMTGLLEGADVVLIDGHHPLLALAAAHAAQTMGIPVVIDAGRWKPVMTELMPYADSVVCSDDFRYPGTDSSFQTAQELVVRGIPTVVTTHGAAPLLWWRDGNDGQVPVPATEARDTSGAGDAFHGAYCYFQAAPGIGLIQCLEGASRVAALRCSVFGPRGWLDRLPTR